MDKKARLSKNKGKPWKTFFSRSVSRISSGSSRKTSLSPSGWGWSAPSGAGSTATMPPARQTPLLLLNAKGTEATKIKLLISDLKNIDLGPCHRSAFH